MDHETAVQSNAAERYLLGEMCDLEREQFEEHYFDCSACAEDVRTGTIFHANARALFAEERKLGAAAAPAPPPLAAGWFARHRMASLSIGLNFLLVMAVSYQAAKVVPGLKRQAEALSTAHYVQEVAVMGTARSEGSARTISSKTGRIAVMAYLPDGLKDVAYEVRDQKGAPRLSGTLPEPPREPSAEMLVSIPISGLEAGEYEVTLRGSLNGSPHQVGQRKFRILPAE